MRLRQRLSANTHTIKVINTCLEACTRAFRCSGPVIEIGSYHQADHAELCDRRPYFPGQEYVGCDVRHGPGVDRIDDVEKLGFPDGHAGTLLILETVEHVANPVKAIAEVQRVLRDDGLLILSVPFAYRLHGFPLDYWRFTASGIDRLLADFPRRTILSLGAAVKPMTIFAVASRGDADEFAKADQAFRAEIERASATLRRRLFWCAMQERGKDLLGLLLGRADVSVRFF